MFTIVFVQSFFWGVGWLRGSRRCAWLIMIWAQVKELREENKVLNKQFQKTEDDLKALQSVGQIIGEVLRQLDTERFIVKVCIKKTIKRDVAGGLRQTWTETCDSMQQRECPSKVRLQCVH